jgi:lysophospholipase L1-like esterase
MKRLLFSLLIGLCAFAPRATPAADEFFFKPNDRIVFLGDSITEQYQYSSYIELYLTTRFPEWNLTFINAGIGGDTATGGANRFASHVLAEKPTCLTIDFGMNDGGYGGFDPNRHKGYVDNTARMLQAAKAAGVRVALISPNAVDRRVNDRFKQYFETQKEFYAPLKEIAAKHEAPFVDQYAITRAVLERLENEKADAVKPFPDGVHTSSSGGLLMAHTILTGLHAPDVVSNVSIQTGSNATATNCVLSDLQRSDNGVSFTRIDQALPLPVQSDWVSLLPYVNELKDVNWYGLTVKSLAPGTYTVKIDDVEVAEFTAEQLQDGVNLGNITRGPVYEQSQKVLQLITAKNQLVHQRFRGVVMFNAPDWLADVANERKAAELKKRTEQIQAKQAEIYQVVKPVPRRFSVQKKV